MSAHLSTDTPSTNPAGPSRHATVGAFYVLAASALWGTVGTVATFAPTGTSPVAVGAATMGIGGLLTFLLAARPALAVLRHDRRVTSVALLGGLCVVIYPIAFYSAMSFAGVAVGTIINIGSSPLFAALYERLGDGTALNRRWAIATASAAVGCVVLIGGGNPVSGTDSDMAIGIALGLLGGATYAGFSYLATRIMRHGHSPRAAMGIVFGLGACALLPMLALSAGPLLTTVNGLMVAGYLAVVPMCLAYMLFGAGLRLVGASTGTTLSLFETLVAAVLSVVVVGERLGLISWSGMVLIAAGLAILTIRPRG